MAKCIIKSGLLSITNSHTAELLYKNLLNPDLLSKPSNILTSYQFFNHAIPTQKYSYTQPQCYKNI